MPPSSSSSARGSDQDHNTSFHARLAVQGDQDSLAWLVTRLSPLLLLQAERRLGPSLRRAQDPEDLVAEVWMTALPRLGTLDVDPEHHAAVLVRYLSTILLGRVRNLARKIVRRRTDGATIPQPTGLDDVAAENTSVIGRILRNERTHAVRQSLQELTDSDRDVIIYRGIEQRPPQEVATLMGLTRAHVAVRYHRALQRLRELLPGSVFDELPDATDIDDS
jgi:RNA polymerase sigma factor (sigma-70 family)